MNAAKFYVYRNLHTGGFSVKHRGRVIDRPDLFTGLNVTFKVNLLGRDRVIREKRKNVHAYSVVDQYYPADKKILDKVDQLKIITYNPYAADYFTCDTKKIMSASSVLFYRGKCYLIDK